MIKFLQNLYFYPAPVASTSVKNYPASDASTTVKNYPALNSVKAILIVLIIITHSLPESMTLYFLYMFHMPVFLGISGFLLKESAFKNGIGTYVRRLQKRLIIPWIIAFAVYLPFQFSKLTSSNPLDLLLYPFYHLWYIPAYIIGSIACYAIYKWKIPVLAMLFLTAIITVTWYIYFRDIHDSTGQQPLYWLGDKRLYCYAFFYVLGYALRNNLIQFRMIPATTVTVLIFSFLLITLCVFQRTPDYFTVLPYLFFNASLIIFLVFYVAEKSFFQHRFWLYINNNSLGIYFYHPLILMLIFKGIGDPLKEHVSTIDGIVIGLLTLGLCFPLTWLLNKWKLSSRFMLGNV